MIGVSVQAWQRWRRHGWLLFVLVVVGLLAWGPGARHVRAAALLSRFEGARSGFGGWLAGVGKEPVRRADLTLHTAAGPLRARRYRPAGDARAPGLMLVHGVHYEGIDEPRLMHFAQVLASTGFDVVTPEIDPLADLRIEPTAIGDIGAGATACARLLGERTVGVVGISFAGGLALIAAADPKLGRHIGYVVAVGAHDDLVRVARWYAGLPVTGPNGREPPVGPHPYGADVIVDEYVASFFSPEDIPVAKKALHLLVRDRWRSAKAQLPELSPTGQATLRQLMGKGDRRALDARLLDVIGRARKALRSVSPTGKLAHLHKPVLLIAGVDDPVVPSTETLWLARQIPRPYVEDVLVTPVLRHAEERRPPTFIERWRIVDFFADMLSLATSGL